MQAYIALPGISNSLLIKTKWNLLFNEGRLGTGSNIGWFCGTMPFCWAWGKKNSLWGVMSKLRHVLGNCSTLTQRVDSEQSVAQTQLVFRCFNSTKE